MNFVRDIMTKGVVSIDPDMPLIGAVNLLLKHGFNGLPVTVGGMLVGVITEYDMITKGSTIHIPTLLKIFGSLDKKNSDELSSQLKQVITMKVKDAMNSDPLTLSPDDSIIKLVDTFTQHHKVNPIPIVTDNKLLVGIVSRSDMVKFLGDQTLDLSKDMSEAEIDKNVDRFIKNFENRFVLVTKNRTKLWLVASILFGLVGFAVAWFLILRVNL